MDWFLYDNGLRHERVNPFLANVSNPVGIYLFKINNRNQGVKYFQS